MQPRFKTAWMNSYTRASVNRTPALCFVIARPFFLRPCMLWDTASSCIKWLTCTAMMTYYQQLPGRHRIPGIQQFTCSARHFSPAPLLVKCTSLFNEPLVYTSDVKVINVSSEMFFDMCNAPDLLKFGTDTHPGHFELHNDVIKWRSRTTLSGKKERTACNFKPTFFVAPKMYVVACTQPAFFTWRKHHSTQSF